MSTSAESDLAAVERTSRAAMELFERFVDADDTRRRELLEESAERHPEAHAQLLRLIAADRAAEREHFLGANAVSDLATNDAGPVTVPDLVGEQIGAWRLERLLGVGGAGQVWLARRCDGLHTGLAAVKLLRAEAFDGSSPRRLAREGRLLARLAHPNIARLLDVGEHTPGQRFLVLEYVDGERIDAFCDRDSLSVDGRLRLFLRVCDAVAYAHANLIVHRDLKPSNVLVQPDGTAKLLDFGVAKLLDNGDDDLRETTELTRAGRAPFTPEYAAPEQFDGLPITVATDVYALGALLYLLLAGRRAHGGEAATPAKLAQAAMHVEPLRLSLAAAGDDAERIASLRASSPQHLRRALRGDLDTLVAKAMKKDPAERYASAQALADDVRRHLGGLPILARPDGRLYHARKFVGRHRLGVAFAALAALILVVAGTALLIQAARLEREAARATTIKRLLLESFVSADDDRTDGEPANDVATMLTRASRRLDEEAGMDADTRAEAHATVANIYSSWNRYDEAQEHYGKARDLYRERYGEDSLQALQVEEASLMDERHHGRFAHLMPRIDRLLALIGHRDEPEWRRLRWLALEIKALTALGLGDLPAARETAEKLLVDLSAGGGAGTDVQSSVLEVRVWIARAEGAPMEAERYLREAIALDRRLYRPHHVQVSDDLLSAVDVLDDLGADAEAEQLAQRAVELRMRSFGPHHIATSWALGSRATVAGRLGRDDEAGRLFAQAAAIDAEVRPPNPSGLAVVQHAYGMHLLRRGRFEEAATQLDACARQLDESGDAWHWRRSACKAALAYCRAHGADADDARATLERQIAEQRAHAARDLPTALWLRARLAAEGLAPASPEEQRAWLNEGAAIMEGAGRDGSLAGREIEEARRALGDAPAPPPPPRGGALAEAAWAMAAASDAP
jgi:serine/threonine-protein kinase